MNKIVLMGRLTGDPESRMSSGGTQIVRYSLAVDRRFKRDGEADADFFNCTVFGKGAEFADKYLRKGTKVVIVGRMEMDKYTNKDGQQVTAWKVVVEEQEFAESKKSSEENPAPKDGFVEVPPEEDLPFI